MSNGVTRGSRGWFYALLVAASMFAVFYVGNTYIKFGKPVYRDPRTAFLTVSTIPARKEKRHLIRSRPRLPLSHLMS